MVIQIALVVALVACAQYYMWTVGRSRRRVVARSRPLRESEDRVIRLPF
jgi:hypothetical protein